MKKWIEKKGEKERIIIGGDFNARIGREGGIIEEKRIYRLKENLRIRK